ncbi:MAG: hypothetical protein KBC94_07830 [Pseudacidovorax sp.]|uniref:hypothetical protein n=1 Tax=Pseudacidovorax sp. TaxID=1934311 RepID=UPI001B3F271B|nr:hypothetical protein [Pseudacidovorax sp.]MBP6894316.1 hypothetical protein [Pseudacidovorax sp.]
MLQAARLLTIFLTPLVFWGAWYVVPDLLAASGLRWLSGIVTVLWGLELWFFQRLSGLGPQEALSSRENERLVYRLASIRRRVWWIGGIGLVCAVAIWLLVELQLPTSAPIYAAMVGVLFGISVSYLILIPGWVNESQAFIDEVKRQEVLKKRRDEAAKVLTGGAAKSK